MSRTTRFNHIHLDENMLLKFYYNINPPVLERINAKQNSLFKNGKMYEVAFDNEMVYLGSTCETLETRLTSA